MGKHEREKVENQEKYLVAILNNNISEINYFKSFLTQKEISVNNNLSKEIINFINNDYNLKINKTIHIGNTYGQSLGDIKLILSDERIIYIELKYLNSGSGTRANISQNALTDYKIFPNSKSWSIFREEENHDSWVLKKLSEKINTNLFSCNSPRPLICKMAKKIKQLAENGDNEASKIIQFIKDNDAKEKKKYIQYLSNQNLNKNNLRKFVTLILTGNHTKECFKEYENTPFDKISIPDNYKVIYAYHNKKVYIENIELIINKIKNIEYDIKIYFPKNSAGEIDQTNIILYIENNSEKINLLRIVFHWKNKFQGIETPCLNIFDEFKL
jgi:hypothetical protein